MAWLDDRVWCHPKLADVSKPARWGWVASVCYSSGFQTRGKLTNGQLQQIGVVAKERRELVAAALWHEIEGGVQINDWDEHNSSRDERRAKDRERKRRERQKKRPQDVTRDSHVTAAVTLPVTARVEGSEGSEGSEGRTSTNPEAVTEDAADTAQDFHIQEVTPELREIA